MGGSCHPLQPALGGVLFGWEGAVVGSPLGPPGLQRTWRGGLEVFGGQRRVWVCGLEDTTPSWSWLWRWSPAVGGAVASVAASSARLPVLLRHLPPCDGEALRGGAPRLRGHLTLTGKACVLGARPASWRAQATALGLLAAGGREGHRWAHLAVAWSGPFCLTEGSWEGQSGSSPEDPACMASREGLGPQASGRRKSTDISQGLFLALAGLLAGAKGRNIWLWRGCVRMRLDRPGVPRGLQGGSESRCRKAGGRWPAARSAGRGWSEGRRRQEVSSLAAGPCPPPPGGRASFGQCLRISPEVGFKTLGSGLSKEQCFPGEGAGLYRPFLLSQCFHLK